MTLHSQRHIISIYSRLFRRRSFLFSISIFYDPFTRTDEHEGGQAIVGFSGA